MYLLKLLPAVFSWCKKMNGLVTVGMYCIFGRFDLLNKFCSRTILLSSLQNNPQSIEFALQNDAASLCNLYGDDKSVSNTNPSTTNAKSPRPLNNLRRAENEARARRGGGVRV